MWSRDLVTPHHGKRVGNFREMTYLDVTGYVVGTARAVTGPVEA
jgi:hypothetical protein